MSPRRSRYFSPPPPGRSNRSHGAVGSLKKVATAIAAASHNTYRETSPFHRLLISQLLVVVVSIGVLKPERADPLLFGFLGLIKIALVADCISIVTLRMRRISSSNKALNSLLYRVPFATGPLVELALATQMLRQSTPSSANRFLIGSIYAKLLLAGGCCLILHGLRCASATVELRSAKVSPVPWLLGVSGALILVSAPQIESMFRVPHKLRMLTTNKGHSRWISSGAPLFIMMYMGIKYYFESHEGGGHSSGTSDEGMEDSTDLAVQEWVVLLLCVAALKAAAFILARNILDRTHAMAAILDSESSFLTSSVFVDFIVLPLVAAAVDHLPDIATAGTQPCDQPWTNLIQSALQTYFFTRPLATLAGHDIDPKDGRMGIGFGVLSIAVWLWFPGVPRKSIFFLMTC
jgi:Ca2+/H+ antiporter